MAFKSFRYLGTTHVGPRLTGMELNLHVSQRLTEAISALAHELCEIRKDRQKDSEIKESLFDIETKLDQILENISDEDKRLIAASFAKLARLATRIKRLAKSMAALDNQTQVVK